MRLIDAERFEELFNQQVEFGATDLFDAVDDALQDTESIDPKTLPLVQELRAQLARVTAERDAAVKDLYAVKACKTCALQFSDDCLLEECLSRAVLLSARTPRTNGGESRRRRTMNEYEKISYSPEEIGILFDGVSHYESKLKDVTWWKLVEQKKEALEDE